MGLVVHLQCESGYLHITPLAAAERSEVQPQRLFAGAMLAKLVSCATH